MRIIGPLILALGIFAFGHSAVAAPLQVVPSGWKLVSEPTNRARMFLSPDGSARIRLGHEAATRFGAERFMRKRDEQITYERRGATWFVVSGYRGGEIFYRKGNLACRGSRWNLIEFRYPREDKLKMDETVAMVAHNMAAYSRDCG